MELRHLPGYVRDTLLRMLPHSTTVGLVRIGDPGRDAPVLLTGNFTLTVRRVKQVLAGRHAWLLCANSKGMNVWCASGGGHLTHHDVISVIRTTGIEGLVAHRQLILPQLCATGVERRKVSEVTGWTTRWGPARLEDLPAFLDQGQVRKGQRFMRFPLWERIEMAVMWSFPMLVIGVALALWLWTPAIVLALVATIVGVVGGLFALLPWLRVTGNVGWLTFALFAALGAALGAVVLWALGAANGTPFWIVAAAGGISALILSVDLAGTTPWFGSTINTWHNDAQIELVDSACTGSADCVQVCPTDVLKMNGTRRKVELVHPKQCIQCAACIVQCPEDALRFRYPDGSVVEATTIRQTRLNMLGRRRRFVEDEKKVAPQP
jgi:ferredoxin